MTFRLNNGFGTTSSPNSGGAVVSPSPSNALQLREDGLFVQTPPASNFTQEEKSKLAAVPADVSTRLASLEDRPTIEGFISRDGTLVLQQTDGSEIVGPVVGVGTSAPVRYTTNQWSVQQGPGEKQITITIKDEVYNGGSPLTAIKYQVGSVAPQILTATPATGDYVATMPQAGASYEISVLATNLHGDGLASAAKTVVSGAQVNVAPAVQTVPVITGNTTVSSILTRTAGTATGVPTPTRTTQWLRNGTVLSGQTANSFDTSGLAGGDVITTRDVWTNTIGGVVQTATGTSEPVTLTLAVVLEIAATISPNPLQAGKPGSITFDIVPENVGGSVLLTANGDGLTYTFMVPQTGNVLISATEAGYEPFSQTYVIDSETIQAVIPPIQTATYAGQKISDIPGVNTTLQASNYTRAGRTINAPQLRRNGQPTTLATVLAKGDVVEVLVTDNLGGSETYLLTTTQYAIELAPQSGGLYRSIDDNPLLPDDLLFPVSYLGATTQTSQARLATGPESHIHVSIVKEGSTYTATPGKWFSRVAGTTALTHQWLKNGTAIPGATGLTLAHIADFDGTTISVQETATDASGTRTRASNGISNADVTAPVLSAPTHNTATNTYGYTTTKPGTLYWAAYVSGGTVPSVNAQGVWTGTTRQTGSLTLQTAGAKAFTPAVTDTQANRLVFAVVDAAGNVSNHLDQPYTQLSTGGTAPEFIEVRALATTANPKTFTNVSLGAEHAERDILVIVSRYGAGAPLPSLTIGGIAAELVTFAQNRPNSPNMSLELWKARVPVGTLGNVVAAGSSTQCVISIFRGVKVEISDTASGMASSPTGTGTLDAIAAGHKIFGASIYNNSVTWSAGTEIYDFDYTAPEGGTGTNRWVSLMEKASTGTTETLTVTRDISTGEALMSSLFFSAGAAA